MDSTTNQKYISVEDMKHIYNEYVKDITVLTNQKQLLTFENYVVGTTSSMIVSGTIQNKEVIIKIFTIENNIEFYLFQSIFNIKSELKDVYLVSFLGDGVLNDGNFKDKQYLIFEKYELDLFQYMKQRKTKLTLKEVLSIWLNLSLTLSYMHSKEYLHGDLFERNIFIKDKTDLNSSVLADLGKAKKIKNIEETYDEHIKLLFMLSRLGDFVNFELKILTNDYLIIIQDLINKDTKNPERSEEKLKLTYIFTKVLLKSLT